MPSNTHGPRRKSCEECFKAKRRCDKNSPSCLRCVKLELNCKYSSQIPRRPNQSRANEDGNPSNTSLIEQYDDHTILPSLQELDDLVMNQDVQTGDDSNVGPLDDSLMWDLTDFGTPTRSQDFQSSTDLLSIQPSSPNKDIYLDLLSVAASRINYSIKLIRDVPTRMVRENSTPWSHALLYKDHMPKSMYDAHAACALYMAINETNKQMIFRAIDIRTKELVASPECVEPLHILANVQSLVLYQIIRLYDGDVRFRAQGEADMDTLKLYNSKLLNLLERQSMSTLTSSGAPDTESSSLGSYAVTQPSLSAVPHKTWLFQESCRRTYLFSIFFLSFYNMLKGGSCASNAFVVIHPWILSSHLWNAPSEFDFNIAKREQKAFEIHNLDFEEFLNTGQPDDIDDFGKMLLVADRGLDEVRAWFYERGQDFLS